MPGTVLGAKSNTKKNSFEALPSGISQTFNKLLSARKINKMLREHREALLILSKGENQEVKRVTS